MMASHLTRSWADLNIQFTCFTPLATGRNSWMVSASSQSPTPTSSTMVPCTAQRLGWRAGFAPTMSLADPSSSQTATSRLLGTLRRPDQAEGEPVLTITFDVRNRSAAFISSASCHAVQPSPVDSGVCGRVGSSIRAEGAETIYPSSSGAAEWARARTSDPATNTPRAFTTPILSRGRLCPGLCLRPRHDHRKPSPATRQTQQNPLGNIECPRGLSPARAI